MNESRAHDFPALSPDHFQAVWERWLEPHRGWHGLAHLEGLLQLIQEEHVLSESDREMVRYVALFHDAIYEPLSSTNEEDSAELAAICLKHYSRCGEVVEAILSTKKHDAKSGLAKQFNAWDCAILHEADWEKLQTYERGIAFEYRQVEPEIYRRERTRFLREAAGLYQNPLLERLAVEVAGG